MHEPRRWHYASTGGTRCRSCESPPDQFDIRGRHLAPLQHHALCHSAKSTVTGPTESIDERDVIERILRHLGLWQQGVRVLPARAPPEVAEWVIEPCYDDPFPDYDTEPVMMYANG